MRILVGWGVAGMAVNVLGQFVVLVALARFTDIATVGAFGLSNAIVWPIVASLSLGLQVNLATDIAGRFSFKDALRLRLICCTIAAALLFAIAAMALDGEARAILMIYGSAKIVEMLSEISFGMFQRAGRMDLVFRSHALRSLGVAVPVFGALSLGVTPTIALSVYVVVWGVVALALDLPTAFGIARDNGVLSPASWQGIKRLVRLSGPLWITGTLAAVQGNVPRYVIGGMLGLVSLGQFTVVAYIMQAVLSVFVAVSDAVVSRLAAYVDRGDRAAFLRSMGRLTGMIGCVAAVSLPLAWVFGDAALQGLFGPDYAGLRDLLVLLLVAAFLNATLTVVQAGLEANRAFAAVAISRTIFLVVLTCSAIAAAHWHGLRGVAWALCLVHVGQMAFQAHHLVRQPLLHKRDGAG